MAAINTKVKKAVIPVAGLGTRMLPATKAIPKEMLPLVDKPLIQYVVNECIAAGITEIVLVTHSSKNSIENHFDTSFELEAMLEKRVKRQLLDEVQSICPPHVTIMQVRQGLAKGLGHAVLCAHPVVGDEPVAVILPDVILDEYESDLSQDNLAEMIRRFDETGHSQIMVEPVQQVISHCRVNYRQLVAADKPGLVLDIAALSENDLAFYCLDVTRAGHNGVLAALLLRALFNGLLQEQLAHQNQRLPELGALLKQVNHLLRQANLPGQFPLLVGYYHRELKNLILVSAGLNATLNTGEHQVQISNGVPLGTLGNAYLNQLSQRCDAWQCQIWGTGGRLRLMLSAE